MASLLAFLLALMTTPLNVHLQRFPQSVQAAYKTNDCFFMVIELWRIDATRKADAEHYRKFDAGMLEFKRRSNEFDLRQAELRRKLEGEAKAKKKPGG